jgi:hypothetical protein
MVGRAIPTRPGLAIRAWRRLYSFLGHCAMPRSATGRPEKSTGGKFSQSFLYSRPVNALEAERLPRQDAIGATASDRT